MAARRGFADRIDEPRYHDHHGELGGLTEEDVRRKCMKGWADKLTPAHRALAIRRGWISR